MNYKLVISYNGSNYHGWAIQPNFRTIQGCISDIIKRIFNINEFVINASGRTDKGVHAIEQVINIKTDKLNIDSNDLMNAINSQLDYDVKVIDCNKIDEKFHARFSCKNKTYYYVINTNSKYDVFCNSIIYQYNKNIDLEKVKKIIPLFIGNHNFLSFSTSEYKVEDCVRNVNSLDVTTNNNLLIIKINANGFLRNMVRMIVGTILAYNENLITLDFINDCLNHPQKGKCKFKAPACGLYLFKVNY